jgi:hypothetical protein
MILRRGAVAVRHQSVRLLGRRVRKGITVISTHVMRGIQCSRLTWSLGVAANLINSLLY